MDTAEKILYPVVAVGAIVGLWFAFKKQPAPAVGNQISPQASGLPNYTPQAVNYQVNPPQLAAPTPIQLLSDPYNANPGQPLPANPPVYMSFNFGPGMDLTKVPLTPAQQDSMSRLRPRINQLTPDQEREMNAAVGPDKLAQLKAILQQNYGCGCGSGSCASHGIDLSCNSCGDVNKGNYPDGAGNGVMAKNGRQLVHRLVQQDPGWMPRQMYNLYGSDVTPQTLPHAFNTVNPNIHSVPVQPAAPSNTLSPSSPGSNIINEPVYKASRAIVGTVADNLGWSPAQWGNQNPKVSPSLLSRLTGVVMPTVQTNSYHGGPFSSQNG